MNFKPYDYQQEAINALSSVRKQGVDRGMIVLASGLGKTLTATFDIQRFLDAHPDARILVLCHSEAILSQSKQKFQEVFGEEYSYGMYTSNYKVSRRVDFTFATFQTMHNAKNDFTPEAFDYVVVDEAHHTPAPTYRPTVDYFRPKFLLGLTATDERMDGQSLAEIYHEPIYRLDIFSALAQNLLSPVDYRLVLDDWSKLDQYLSDDGSTQKVTMSELNRTVFAPKRDEEIVRLIQEYSAEIADPTTFIFCKSIEHAERIAELYAGKAAVIHSDRDKATNDAILADFKAGRIKTLVSVSMLNEGIDVPHADIVVFLRDTTSKIVYLQQLGRGLRRAPGKEKVLVLDFVGSAERMAMVFELEQKIASQSRKLQSVKPKSVDRFNASQSPLIVNIPTPKFAERKIDIVELLNSAGTWSAERILEIYYRESVSAGHWLTQKEINQNVNLPSEVHVYRLVGSLRKVRTLVNNKYGFIYSLYPTSDIEVIDRYYEASKKACHWLRTEEINHHNNLPSYMVVRCKFGGLMALRELAKAKYGELSCLTASPNGESEADFTKRYFMASKDAGHWLSLKELDDLGGYPTRMTLSRRYGGIKRLRQTATELYGNLETL